MTRPLIFVPALLLVFLVINIPEPINGLVEPIVMPDILKDCYQYRTQVLNVTDMPAHEISAFCITNFLYKTYHLRPQRPIANETIQYAQELFRQVFGEAQKRRRVKRQFIQRVRQEVRVMSRQLWNTFVTRVNMLKNQFVGRNISRYDAFADIHRLVIDSAHGGPNFLGWHAVYLILFEQAIGIPVPYWDSRLDFYMEQPTDSILWTPEFFGEGFGAVTNGPFANWYTPDNVPLTRNIGNAGTLISDANVQSVLTRTRHREIVEPNPNPQFSLEIHHNGPHVWVDGQLSAAATAAQDPVFFLHHSFVNYFWVLFRRRQRSIGIDPATDYPPTNNPLQQPFNRMIPFQLRNIDGYSNQIEALSTYQPPPTCPSCGGSSYLECFNNRCRSRVGLVQSGPAAAGFAGMGGMGGAAAFTSPTAGGQARAMQTVAQTGPLPIGNRFNTPFRDPRTRGDTIPNAPVRDRVRRSTSTNTTSARASSSNFDTSQINKPYQNTFLLNGVSDVNRWSFIPVRIIFERTPKSKFQSFIIKDGHLIEASDMFEAQKYQGLKVEIKKKLPATYSKCHVSGSGASKVYVQTDGIDYSGRYKDYAVVDERLPISSSMTYIGVKNPTDGAAQFYMTAYDSCGRVCRPQCLTNGNYRPCSGTFRITSTYPRMYGLSYEDAVKGIWKKGNNLMPESNAGEVPITFFCDAYMKWPWVFE
ncbi:tyrosinase-like protein 1 [Ylistrum balloti]|uniref:tyrosinase-like protein 1 n=1 Tax=Ylistrum balloti TaxID=509963 RepID=UPI002905B372|nr:tyrosinase-like protein 1 [Ylistrum balloti]